MGSWITSEWVLVTRKTKPRLKAWNFQPYPSPSREGRGAGVSSCLHDGASIKIPKRQGPESPRVGEVLLSGRAAPRRRCGSFPPLALCITSICS